VCLSISITEFDLILFDLKSGVLCFTHDDFSKSKIEHPETAGAGDIQDGEDISRAKQRALILIILSILLKHCIRFKTKEPG
jgi:hypothetical protein